LICLSYLRALLKLDTQNMKLFYFFLFTVFFSQLSLSQDFTIRGFIYNKADGEPMPFEKVKLLAPDSTTLGGSVTDVNGFFSMSKLDRGEYIVKVESALYKTITQNVSITEVKGIEDINIQLEKKDDVQNLTQIDVSAESQRNKTQVGISEIRMDKKGLERVPSMGAENDIVGAFSITPGVVTTGDQGGQLYVRGGTPIQNKILLDGMTIYNPFHSIGFFSIFETELVQNVSIFTGGFDAKYGGRISSIMDITYRDGDRKKFGGKISVSPFLAKVVLEGPFVKAKEGKFSPATYVFSAKHSLLDYLSKSIYPRVTNGDGMPFSFTDLYGKITFKGDGGSKFNAFGFYNDDKVNYDIANINWTQGGGGINFLLVPNSSPIFVRGHVNGSYYGTTFLEPTEGVEPIPRTSSIGGFDLGFDFTYFLKNNGELNYGINLNGFSTKYETYNTEGRKIADENFTTEIGIFLSYNFVSTRWVIQPSFRAQMYASMGTISPEPRLGIKFNATEKFRLKASGGRFSQNFTSVSSDKDVVNLFNGFLSAPTNVQETFVTYYQNEKTPKNGLQYAWHAIGGFELDITKKISANVEGYYKYFSQLSNINNKKYYADDDKNPDIDDIYKKDFILENGESYGVDVLIKYSGSRLFLWGVYSYGHSIRWDGDTTYFPVFDRRHNLNLVGTYLFGKKKDLELSIRWNLGSGLPYTPTVGNFESQNFGAGVTTDYTTTNANSITTNLGDLNSERLPYYHRLDITVKKRFVFKNESVIEVIGSLTNTYNRRNIFYVNRVTNEKIYQFPILPSLGLSYKF
jgi:hypothetical protein